MGRKDGRGKRCSYPGAEILMKFLIEIENGEITIDTLDAARLEDFKKQFGQSLRKALTQFRKHLKRCKLCQNELKKCRGFAKRLSGHK